MSLPILDDLPLVLDEADIEIPCEKWMPTCSKSAEWIVRCRRCSNPTFMCAEHLAKLRSANEWICLKCDARSRDFDEIAEVTKL